MSEQNEQKDQKQQKQGHCFTLSKPLRKNPDRVWQQWEFPKSIGKYTLMGYSRAADRTFFTIPELKIALDAGGCRGRVPPYFFLTHTHFDHVIDVWYILPTEITTMYCPIGTAKLLRNFVQYSLEMNSGATFEIDRKRIDNYALIEVNANEEILYDKVRNIYIKVVQCHHKIPSIGYAFFEKRKKLKEEYKNLSKNEFIQLKKEKIEVTHEVIYPLFVYMGDTNASVFFHEESQWIFDYPIIITECTFLDDETIEKADIDGHVHWRKLEPVVLSHPNIIFVLIHFSLRYSVNDINNYFINLTTRIENPLNLDNVVLFLCDESAGVV